jgi:hypothetical protein
MRALSVEPHTVLYLIFHACQSPAPQTACINRPSLLRIDRLPPLNRQGCFAECFRDQVDLHDASDDTSAVRIIEQMPEFEDRGGSPLQIPSCIGVAISTPIHILQYCLAYAEWRSLLSEVPARCSIQRMSEGCSQPTFRVPS